MHCAFQAGFMSEAMWLVFKNIAILKFGSIGAGGDLFGAVMLKKHKSHGYIVANASVQFTFNWLER